MSKVDDAVSQVTESPKVSRRFARAYIVTLFVVVGGGLVVAYHLGIVQPTASPDVTEAAEWLVKGLVLTFLLFTAAMLVRAVGLGFIKGVVRGAARMMDQYTLPDDEE
jgi:hypothetical protein